jgi:hypothetical protein
MRERTEWIRGRGKSVMGQKKNSTKNQNIWCCYLIREYTLLNKLRAISQQTALSTVILEKLINYMLRNFHLFIKFFFFIVSAAHTFILSLAGWNHSTLSLFGFFFPRRSAFTHVLWRSHNCNWTLLPSGIWHSIMLWKFSKSLKKLLRTTSGEKRRKLRN